MVITTSSWRRPQLPLNPQTGTRAGRFAAILAAACVLCHIPMLASHFTVFPKTTLLMAAVAIACAPCIYRLWARPTRQDYLVAGCLAAVMLGLHLCLILTMADSAGSAAASLPQHRHGSSAMSAADPPAVTHSHTMPPDGFFYVSTLLAVAQVLFCAGIAFAAARRTYEGRPAIPIVVTEPAEWLTNLPVDEKKGDVAS